MNILYGLYFLLTNSLFLSILLPVSLYTYYSGRSNKRLKERLGFLPPGAENFLSGSSRIWLHAVSLGEINVAISIIKAFKKMRPRCSIILSTTTEHGYELAMKTFGNELPVIYSPIDCTVPVRKLLMKIRPHVMVFLETEIWPTWITEAHRMGIKIAMINGRISKRSFNGYFRLRPFFRIILKNIDAFSMIGNEDASRIHSLGADSHKISINGNAKYDLLPSLVDPTTEADMRKTLNLESSQLVFVAGSTREGEEPLVLDAYEKLIQNYPDLILIIAPRHIKRTQEIADLIEKRGFRYQLRSQLIGTNKKRTEKILIINIFGELFKIYSIGTIIFCGASLVSLGGQNPLEAAAWGKVVFYGPSMENFLDAKILLEKANAGICVSNATMLAESAMWFIEHPDLLRKYGAQARNAIMKNQNAARKHARIISTLFDQ